MKKFVLVYAEYKTKTIEAETEEDAREQFQEGELDFEEFDECFECILSEVYEEKEEV